MKSEWVSTIYALLPHPSTGKILILQQDGRWSLPSVQLEGKVQLAPEIVTQEMKHLLGYTVIAYRYVLLTEDDKNLRKEGIFLLDSLNKLEDLPENNRWVNTENLNDFQFDRLDHLTIINEFFSEIETGTVPNFRQPWERSGWFSTALLWIKESLATHDMKIVAEPQQVKWWSLSCVLRVATTKGNVYFKVSAQQPMFVQESEILKCLDHLYPGRVPILLGSEPSKGWMLMLDAGSQLERNISSELKAEVIKVFGRIQLDSVNYLNQFLDLGCVDRRPHHLISHITSLFEDDLVISELTEEEINELRQKIPTIMEKCKQLLDYSVPSTLVHGDLHLGNVAVSNSQILFYDWTDASVAHPFMDMLIIFNERDPILQSQLRDTYLSLWIEYEPMERLLVLWSLCEVVHSIYHAISYQCILQNTEERSRGELGSALPHFLRKAIHHLKNV